MDSRDKKMVIEQYNERLAKFPDDDIAILAVGSTERRKISFDVLFGVGLDNGCRVLDLGCGLGCFYAYLQERGIEAEYVGYDVNPRLIEIARERYPGIRFKVVDILESAFPKFDFIVSSTTFNLKLESVDNYEFVEQILRTCYAHAECGVAIDFLTSYVDFRQPWAFYYEPEKVFTIAKRITKRVCLRHDYPLYQFCVYLYPDFQGWGR